VLVGTVQQQDIPELFLLGLLEGNLLSCQKQRPP